MLPANVRLDWKVIDKYKHSSLFGLVVSNREKKSYNIDTRPVSPTRLVGLDRRPPRSGLETCRMNGNDDGDGSSVDE